MHRLFKKVGKTAIYFILTLILSTAILVLMQTGQSISMYGRIDQNGMQSNTQNSAQNSMHGNMYTRWDESASSSFSNPVSSSSVSVQYWDQNETSAFNGTYTTGSIVGSSGTPAFSSTSTPNNATGSSRVSVSFSGQGGYSAYGNNPENIYGSSGTTVISSFTNSNSNPVISNAAGSVENPIIGSDAGNVGGFSTSNNYYTENNSATNTTTGSGRTFTFSSSGSQTGTAVSSNTFSPASAGTPAFGNTAGSGGIMLYNNTTSSSSISASGSASDYNNTSPSNGIIGTSNVTVNYVDNSINPSTNSSNSNAADNSSTNNTSNTAGTGGSVSFVSNNNGVNSSSATDSNGSGENSGSGNGGNVAGYVPDSVNQPTTSQSAAVNQSAAQNQNPSADGLTRGLLATELYRIMGEPNMPGASSFSDVAQGGLYADAILWAETTGVMSGSGNGEFRPGNAVSREQLAAVLYRFMYVLGHPLPESATDSGYADSQAVSEYARLPVSVMSQHGVFNGIFADNGQFNPKTAVSRAEMALILNQFMEIF